MSGALSTLICLSYRTCCNSFSCSIVPKTMYVLWLWFWCVPKKCLLPADNKAKVYYGLLKEPDIQYLPVEEEEDGEGDGTDKPKKKKAKKDPLFSKKTKSDPNAPPVDRIPLPDLWVSHWIHSPLTRDTAPGLVCFVWILEMWDCDIIFLILYSVWQKTLTLKVLFSLLSHFCYV